MDLYLIITILRVLAVKGLSVPLPLLRRFYVIIRLPASSLLYSPAMEIWASEFEFLHLCSVRETLGVRGTGVRQSRENLPSWS